VTNDLQKAVSVFKTTSFCPAGAEYDESCGLFKINGVFDMMTQRFWEAFRSGWRNSKS